MKIKTNIVFEQLSENNFRNYVFQGSSRAGKTYNIVLWMVIDLLNKENKTYSIIRKTLPSLKGSVLRDLKEILLDLDLYEESKWHSVDGYYELGTNIIEWFSLDTEEKIRGRKRDVGFINEATELTYDEYVQLSLRTTEKMILDLNPSLWKSWIYDLEGQQDTFYSITTFEDNPFLPKEQVEEILKLKDRDANLWRVFGLGQRGIPTRMVFTHQKTYQERPREAKLLAYGIDWGYSDPSTLVVVYKQGDNIYCEELLYLKNVTIPDFIYKIKDLGINLTDDFIADSANPQAIEELRRQGINCKPVSKSSILHGIDLIKRHHFYVHELSKNLQNELQSYVWKIDKNNNNLDEPLSNGSDHLIDGIRYVLEMKIAKNNQVYIYA